jgi:hypothetical protein
VSRRLTVSLRKDFVEVEDGSGYSSMYGLLEYVGAGQWQAIWPKHTDAARALTASRLAGEDLARWGVVVREEGSPEVVWSGPVLTATRTSGAPSGYARDSVTCYGMTDTGILAGYLGFMTPATDVSTTAATIGTAYDTRTGAAETVLLGYITANVGSGALARREIAELVVPASLGRGSTITYKSRFHSLLDVARSVSVKGGVGVRLVQGGRGELLVEPSVPVARPGLVWSVEAGTLVGSAWTWTAAEATDVIAGGRDELTTRNFVRSTATAPTGGFGFRRERFSAQTNVEDGTDLKESADELLLEGASQNGIQVEPTESVQWRYGVDYALGDLVTVSEDGQSVTDRLERLAISDSDGAAPRWSPSIGEWSVQRQADVARRIASGLARL